MNVEHVHSLYLSIIHLKSVHETDMLCENSEQFKYWLVKTEPKKTEHLKPSVITRISPVNNCV